MVAIPILLFPAACAAGYFRRERAAIDASEYQTCIRTNSVLHDSHIGIVLWTKAASCVRAASMQPITLDTTSHSIYPSNLAVVAIVEMPKRGGSPSAVLSTLSLIPMLSLRKRLPEPSKTGPQKFTIRTESTSPVNYASLWQRQSHMLLIS
jgi:hypothetical protein